VPKGLVIRQTPEPGAKVEKGSKITVIISNGPEQIPPKEVTREITIPYEPEVEGEQQEVKIHIEDMNRNISEPFETFSMTETKTRIIELDILPGTTGGYRIMRDDKVFLEEVVPYPE
jgi:serine/threonine-protein kinase